MGTREGWFWELGVLLDPATPPTSAQCRAPHGKENGPGGAPTPRQLPARASTLALLGTHSQSQVIPTEAGPSAGAAAPSALGSSAHRSPAVT